MGPDAARIIREEVSRAGGREVSFLADVTRDRVIENPKAVARGNYAAVLAVARDAPAGGVMIHNHPSGVLEPSEADMAVAARLHDEGLGTAIVTNQSRPPLRGRGAARAAPSGAFEAGGAGGPLGPAGPLSALRGYEDREGQRDMLRFVAKRFNEGGAGLAEAGTGTGKSIAYLVPAARWALDNKERVVVSTNTINLQEQLAGKDIDIAAEVLGAT